MNNKETAYPGGLREYTGGNVRSIGSETHWWSSSVSGATGFYHGLLSNYTTMNRNANYNAHGFSVRYVRNLTRQHVIANLINRVVSGWIRDPVSYVHGTGFIF